MDNEEEEEEQHQHQGWLLDAQWGYTHIISQKMNGKKKRKRKKKTKKIGIIKINSRNGIKMNIENGAIKRKHLTRKKSGSSRRPGINNKNINQKQQIILNIKITNQEFSGIILKQEVIKREERKISSNKIINKKMINKNINMNKVILIKVKKINDHKIIKTIAKKMNKSKVIRVKQVTNKEI